MRRIYLLLLTVLCITSAQAQNNSSRVGLGVGVLWEKGMDATVFWEYETRYHHAWEVFANGYLKWDDCETCDKICSDSFSVLLPAEAPILIEPYLFRDLMIHGL